MSLSPVQQQAVEHIDGPSLVIAGAGSGKTRVLTYKIAHLLQQGYKPWNILALTFTNKAAKEMKERIARLVPDADGLNMGTFHSIFAKILRYEAHELEGFSQNYTIYDDADSRQVIKDATRAVMMQLLNLNPGQKLTEQEKSKLDEALKAYKPQSVASAIGLAKNRMITPQMYAANRQLQEHDAYRRMPAISKIYAAYDEALKRNNAMDFDDLLLKTYQLLQSNELVRQKYAERFKFVLVDEFQDTNTVQQKIIELIVKEHHRICVVGDDAQSIYAFRGANIDNILNFTKVFPEAKIFKLEENYRSTKSIVAVANDLIGHNERQIRKNVYSNGPQGEKPQILHTLSDKEEAAVIAKKIGYIHSRDHIPYDDFVILYRTNSQSRQFEEALRKEALPYRIYGGMSFYQRAEIKNIIAYFRLISNPNDDEALLRIINYPRRGIGQTTIDRLRDIALSNNLTLWNTLQTDLPSISKGTQRKLTDFAQLISGFIAQQDEMDAAALGKHIIKEAGISADLFSDTSPEGISRQENLQELINSLQEFVQIQQEEGNVDEIQLRHFLSQAALQTDQEVVDARDDDAPKVTLMTMHAAKGLEYDTVFIVGLEEELFPSPRCTESARALEEERRLLYVAITRAKRLCFLSYADNRYTYGRPQNNPPCRFLKDISPELLNNASKSRQSFGNSYGNAYGNSFGNTFGNSYGSTFGNSYGNSYTQQRASAFQRPATPQTRRPQTPPANFKPVAATYNRATSPFAAQPAQSAQSSAAATVHTNNPNLTGATIEHSRFGRGRVLKVEGRGDEAKATVQFEHTGTKQLLLKFARFTIIQQ